MVAYPVRLPFGACGFGEVQDSTGLLQDDDCGRLKTMAKPTCHHAPEIIGGVMETECGAL